MTHHELAVEFIRPTYVRSGCMTLSVIRAGQPGMSAPGPDGYTIQTGGYTFTHPSKNNGWQAGLSKSVKIKPGTVVVMKDGTAEVFQISDLIQFIQTGQSPTTNRTAALKLLAKLKD